MVALANGQPTEINAIAFVYIDGSRILMQYVIPIDDGKIVDA